jgi:hypothetical protein
MDITEAFRGEDISKTDFFDFVVTPDIEHQQNLNFNRTLKSMGIFIESSGANNSNNNNDPGTTTYQDVKETNNNHLMMTSTTAPSGLPPTEHSMGSFGDHPFWTPSSCDKETVRLETAILEDLNKFCWSQDSTDSASPNSNGDPCHKVSISNSTHNNTDGAIYTLTVLNGGDHGATWYRTPEAPTSLKDDDETHQQSLTSSHNMDCQQINSHNNQQNHSSALDLDSILSIIPNQASTATTPTSTGHQFHQNGYHQNHSHSANHLHQTNDSTVNLSPHHTISQDGLLKSEQQYTYEGSGYVNKDCIRSHIVDGPSLIQQDASGGDSSANFNNNNNDWKLANNNSNSTADSLLRNALQGKSLLGRYNGTNPKNGKPMEGGPVELRRVLSTPPNGAKTPMEHSPVFITNDITDDCSGGDQKASPMMTVTMEGNAVVLFDGGGGTRGLGLTDSDNPSSAHSMDDILLSQLDAASYPEDYEKLKRIANEVAESVNQYCSLDQNSIASPTQHTPSGIYISTHLSSAADNLVPNSILSSTHHHHHHHHHANLSTVLTTSQSTTKTSVGKKYTKKQSGGVGSGSTKAAHSSHQLQSNGVRKERSLHYCSICSKGFKDKYSVNVHIRTHTGEKPFACSLCGKSFRQKAHLAKHYQTHIAQKNTAANSNGVTKPGANKGRYSSAKSS